mmetsp:Transcript_19468/g.27746  ORF Transcript_19468/g.27746 Transcript_19468/m.27746 type:complete len:333 (+) Transcript_19468:106-1104(+)
MTCFSFFSSCIALLLGSFHIASAYPTGAGTCEAGPAVLYSTSPHLAKYGKGTLTDGGYVISWVNGTYLLEATGSGNYFKGFLLRLSSNDTSAAGAFTLKSKYSNVTQLMESTGESVGSYGSPATCDTTVAGVTHTENSEKTKVAVQLQLKGGSVYSMGVTVVKASSEWYYSEAFYGIFSGETSGRNPTRRSPVRSPRTKSPSSTKNATAAPTPAGENVTLAPTVAPTPKTTFEALIITKNGTQAPTPTSTSSSAPVASPTGSKPVATTSAPVTSTSAPSEAKATTGTTTTAPVAPAPIPVVAVTSPTSSAPIFGRSAISVFTPFLLIAWLMS